MSGGLHMPDVDGPIAPVVIVVPGNDVVRLPRIKPTVDVFTKLCVAHRLQIPNCPVRDIGRQLVGIAIRLQQNVTATQYVIQHEALAVSLERSVHPLETLVLLSHHVIAPLPWTDAYGTA